MRPYVKAKFSIDQREAGSFKLADVILGVDFDFIAGSKREPTFSVIGAGKAVVPCTDSIVVQGVAKMKTRLLKFDELAVTLTFPCGGKGSEAKGAPAFTAKGTAESLLLHAAGVELHNVAVEFQAVRDAQDGEMFYSGTLTSAKPDTTDAGALAWSGTLRFTISTSAGLVLTTSAGAHYVDDSFKLDAHGEMFMARNVDTRDYPMPIAGVFDYAKRLYGTKYSNAVNLVHALPVMLRGVCPT